MTEKKRKSVMTREEWLRRAARALAPLINEHLPGDTKLDLSGMMVSAGFPKYGSSRAIGQCWHKTNTSDGTTHIFVCPTLTEDLRVMDVLLHELIHFAVGTECGHRGEFRRVAQGVGLAGKMTATVVEPDSDLHNRLKAIGEKLGAYPHSPITKVRRTHKPAGGGWIKYRSEGTPDYILRISPRALELYGPPRDFEGDEMVPCDDDSRGVR